eukprot:TRINITY_DN31193_c0_g1_i1.p1 TRINITY_DN31193_c0_g1~~TRINITY_DN31193_c0_g1_i1.p1  ORF type:complete len:773 (-),score=142.50 TRINITY_DN31193_c0_g1_i1:17-2335(-)
MASTAETPTPGTNARGGAAGKKTPATMRELPPSVFRVVCEYVENGIRYCGCVSSFWQTYAAVEEEAAAKIVKLCQSSEANLAQRSLLNMIFSKKENKLQAKLEAQFKEVWFTSRDQVEKIAAARQQGAVTLRQAVQPLAEFVIESGKRVTEITMEGNTYIRELQRNHEILQQKQQLYYNKRKASIRMSNKHFDFIKKYHDALGEDRSKLTQQNAACEEIAERGSRSAPKDLFDQLSKLNEKRDNAKQEARMAAQDYSDWVTSTQRLQEEFDTLRIPPLFAELQKFELERHRLFKQCMDSLMQLQSMSPASLSEACTAIRTAADRMVGDEEVNKLIECMVTDAQKGGDALPLPGLPDYEPFDGKEKFFYKHLGEQSEELEKEQDMLRGKRALQVRPRPVDATRGGNEGRQPPSTASSSTGSESKKPEAKKTQEKVKDSAIPEPEPEPVPKPTLELEPLGLEDEEDDLASVLASLKGGNQKQPTTRAPTRGGTEQPDVPRQKEKERTEKELAKAAAPQRPEKIKDDERKKESVTEPAKREESRKQVAKENQPEKQETQRTEPTGSTEPPVARVRQQSSVVPDEIDEASHRRKHQRSSSAPQTVSAEEQPPHRRSRSQAPSRPVSPSVSTQYTALQDSAATNDYFSLFGLGDTDESALTLQLLAKQRRQLSATLHPDNAGVTNRDEAAHRLARINEIYTHVFKTEQTWEMYKVLCTYRKHYAEWFEYDAQSLIEVGREMVKLKKQIKKLGMPVELLKEVELAVDLLAALVPSETE